MGQEDEVVASFEEIGRAIGCTGETARLIYIEAMGKIRRYLRRNPGLAEALFIHLHSDPPHLQYPKIPEEKIPSFD